MVKTLLKKQLMEMFRSYFYNPKTKKTSSKGRTIGLFILFGLLIAGFLGGTFAAASIGLLELTMPFEMDWLFWLLMGSLGVLLGVFGSVFSTYQSLYLAKDNDTLLAMPIPLNKLVSARLLSVFVIDAIYAGVVMLPAMVIYLIYAARYGRLTAATVLGALLNVIFVLTVVMVLCCFLGWVVARVSAKLTNKSFAKLAICLLFLGAYYFFYFKAEEIFSDFSAQLLEKGDIISEKVPFLRFLGSMGAGNLLSALIFAGGAILLLWLAVRFVAKTFLAMNSQMIQTSAGKKERAAKEKSVFAACLGKEFKRFFASANYMLNTGLGFFFAVAAGIALLIGGGGLLEALAAVEIFGAPGVKEGVLAIAVSAVTCIMDVISVPSISLEGKSLWVYQTMPVAPAQILRAKMSVEIIVNGIGALFATVCGLIVLRPELPYAIAALVYPQLVNLTLAAMHLRLGFVRANFNWVNEIYPIKQDMNMLFALLAGFAFVALEAVLFLNLAGAFSIWLFFGVMTAVCLIVGGLCYGWLMKKGAAKFPYLS